MVIFLMNRPGGFCTLHDDNKSEQIFVCAFSVACQ
jgi:hypothetical protein